MLAREPPDPPLDTGRLSDWVNPGPFTQSHGARSAHRTLGGTWGDYAFGWLKGPIRVAVNDRPSQVTNVSGRDW